MPNAIQTTLRHLGVAKETAWSTGVVPTTWVPIDTYKPEEVKSSVKDNARRATRSMDYNVVFTTQHSTHDIEFPFYQDVLGWFLLSLFGQDAVTGTGAYTHAFTVTNGPGKSLSLQHFDGNAETQYTGVIVDEITIKGDANGEVKVTVKAQGKVGTSVTSTTATFSAVKPLVGTLASLTVDAAANNDLFGFDITLKADNKLLYGASGSADPTKPVYGRVEATMKLTFDTDGTEYAKFDKGVHAVVLTLNSAPATAACVFQFTSLIVEKATFDFGNEQLRVDWEGRGLYNTTDAGPVKVTLTNAVATY